MSEETLVDHIELLKVLHVNALVRSTTFSVRSIDRVEEYFLERGITLVDGDAPGAPAIPPEQNHGLLFEFTE